jgi:hypothetical protein
MAIYSFWYRKKRVDLDLIGKHRNTSEISNFDADITCLCIIHYLLCSIGVIETYFFKKYIHLYIACVNLMVNVYQQHNLP